MSTLRLPIWERTIQFRLQILGEYVTVTSKSRKAQIPLIWIPADLRLEQFVFIPLYSSPHREILQGFYIPALLGFSSQRCSAPKADFLLYIIPWQWQKPLFPWKTTTTKTSSCTKRELLSEINPFSSSRLGKLAIFWTKKIDTSVYTDTSEIASIPFSFQIQHNPKGISPKNEYPVRNKNVSALLIKTKKNTFIKTQILKL